jgi:S1-C subfamily serine protease
MPGSPAAGAGARPGELVLAVDGSDVRALSSSVVEGLVATGGSTVELKVQAASGPRVLAVPRQNPGATECAVPRPPADAPWLRATQRRFDVTI